MMQTRLYKTKEAKEFDYKEKEDKPILSLKEAFDQTINILGFKETTQGYASDNNENPLLRFSHLDESIKLTFGFFDEPTELSIFKYDGAMSTMEYLFTDKNEFIQKYLEQDIKKTKYINELVDIVTKKEYFKENFPILKQYFLDDVHKVIKDFISYDRLVNKTQ